MAGCFIRSDRDGDRARIVKFISYRRQKRHAPYLPVTYSEITTPGLVRLAAVEIEVVRATRSLRPPRAQAAE